MIVTIIVKQKHIDKGRACRADCCPIALAIQEQLPTYTVWASIPYCCFWPAGLSYAELKTTPSIKVYLPSTALKWMLKFDQHEICKPFSFELDIPNFVSENV